MTWVPAISEPLCKWFGIRCGCGRWYLRTSAYRRHYQDFHIAQLGVDLTRSRLDAIRREQQS